MINEIYDELREMRLCDSGNHFSLRWLRMNEAYYRTLKSKELKASVKVIARCGNSLRDFGQQLADSEFDVIRSKGQRLNELAQLCFKEAIKQSVN